MDKYTEVSKKNYFQRLWESFAWVLIWIALFFFSFFVLFWNEWKVNLAEVAKTAVEINAENISPDADWKLVSITNILSSENKLWDKYLHEWDFLSLQRVVEMYSWVEKSSTSTKEDLWWTETTTTTYDYKKSWEEFPDNSSDFKVPTWHENPTKSIDSITLKNKDIKIANLALFDNISLPAYWDLSLNETNAILSDGFFLDWNYLYRSVDYDKIPQNDIVVATWTVVNTSTWATETWSTASWSIDNNTTNSSSWNTINTTKIDTTNPKIWDLRISYRYIKNPINNATVFWKLNLAWKSIEQYIWKKDEKLYRAFEWTRDESISTLQSEHNFLTWVLRWVWFVMMWFWLTSVFNPIAALLNFIPIVARVWRWAISIVTFVIALILSVITIILSMIIHNLIALIIVVSLIALWIWFYLYKKWLKKSNQEPKTK